jgi:hypothetical protein
MTFHPLNPHNNPCILTSKLKLHSVILHPCSVLYKHFTIWSILQLFNMGISTIWSCDIKDITHEMKLYHCEKIFNFIFLYRM